MASSQVFAVPKNHDRESCIWVTIEVIYEAGAAHGFNVKYEVKVTHKAEQVRGSPGFYIMPRLVHEPNLRGGGAGLAVSPCPLCIYIHRKRLKSSFQHGRHGLALVVAETLIRAFAYPLTEVMLGNGDHVGKHLSTRSKHDFHRK